LYIAGIVGDDHNGRILMEGLADERTDIGGIIVGDKRKTTLKMRIVAHHQQMVRVDYEDVDGLTKSQIDQLMGYIERQADSIDAFLIEDYGKGMVTQPLLDRLIALGKAAGKIMTFDPKQGHELGVRGVTAVTPNRSEAVWAAGREMPERELGAVLMDKWGCESVLLTLGERGMLIFERGSETEEIPCTAREVYDVSGAGDTVIGTFTLALASGASKFEAAVISNHAAGIVVGKVGTAVVTREELWKEMVSS
jgi:D-glycero-beta-D-manno-heptose-7-phosphate kinase